MYTRFVLAVLFGILSILFYRGLGLDALSVTGGVMNGWMFGETDVVTVFLCHIFGPAIVYFPLGLVMGFKNGPESVGLWVFPACYTALAITIEYWFLYSTVTGSVAGITTAVSAIVSLMLADRAVRFAQQPDVIILASMIPARRAGG